jgi:hypothetical protein
MQVWGYLALTMRHSLSASWNLLRRQAELTQTKVTQFSLVSAQKSMEFEFIFIARGKLLWRSVQPISSENCRHFTSETTVSLCWIKELIEDSSAYEPDPDIQHTVIQFHDREQFQTTLPTNPSPDGGQASTPKWGFHSPPSRTNSNLIITTSWKNCHPDKTF